MGYFIHISKPSKDEVLMQRLIAIACALLLMLTLAACGSKTYDVTTKNGKAYTSVGKPELDRKAQTYTFTNTDGQEVILNQADVDVIEQKKK